MNAVEKIQQEVKSAIHQEVIEAELTEEADIPDIMLETPRNKENGDYATNIAMQLTKIAKKPPRAIAEAIVEHIDKESASIEQSKLRALDLLTSH